MIMILDLCKYFSAKINVIKISTKKTQTDKMTHYGVTKKISFFRSILYYY